MELHATIEYTVEHLFSPLLYLVTQEPTLIFSSRKFSHFNTDLF